MMKKSILLSTLLLITLMEISGQTKPYVSIEADAMWVHHFVGNATNSFNYGFSFLVSENLSERSKFTIGVSYNTLNYYYHVDPSYANDSVNKRDYKSGYINFPVLFSYDFYSKKPIGLGFQTGFVFNKIIQSELTSYYTDQPPFSEEGNPLKGLGVKFRLGFNFSSLLSHRFRLNISPFGDFKVIANGTEGGPGYKYFSQSYISYGIKVGIEYSIRKKTAL